MAFRTINKRLVKRLLPFITVLLLFVSNWSFAQNPHNYLFVEIPGLSRNRGVPELENQLKSIAGIDSLAYCDNVGLLIIRSNPNSTHLRAEVNKLLHSLNYHYTIKKTLPIEEAQKACMARSKH
jgi:hypothetical protein